MNTLPYCSRNLDYKTPFGAVDNATEVTYRILLHHDAGCETAWILLRNDREKLPRQIEMSRGAEYGESYTYFEYSTSFETGLYWYSFAYDGATGYHEITRFEDGNGYLSSEGKEWQQTIFDKDFVTPDWFKGGTMYQIFPDRFARDGEIIKPYGDRCYNENWGGEPAWRQDSDALESGNYLGNDYFGGNLKGITGRLDYIKRLGVSCIYLNPVFEAHSNHRYNTADYMKIDPGLGDAADLENLCEKAKMLGISVILDGVFSHTGDDSIYFNRRMRYDSVGAYNSVDSDYYKWFKFENWPDKYHSWWGIDTLPEVIEETPEFENFICGEGGVLRHWLKSGISGWRLDVADELPDEFLDAVRQGIKSENPDALLIGEVWEDATNKISYGFRRRFLRGGQLDSVMNYPFRDAIIEFLTSSQRANFLDSIMTVLENYPKPAIDCLMNHIGTHDTPRILTVLGDEPQSDHPRSWQSGRVMDETARNRALRMLKVAAALQYTLPGVPCLYYGDEVGMEGYGDPFNRGCFPEGEAGQNITEFYQLLGDIRKNSTVFADGEFIPVSGDAGRVAYIRKKGDEEVFVAVNRWDDPSPMQVDKKWESAEVLLGSSPIGGLLIIPGRGVSILKLSGNRVGSDK